MKKYRLLCLKSIANFTYLLLPSIHGCRLGKYSLWKMIFDKMLRNNSERTLKIVSITNQPIYLTIYILHIPWLARIICLISIVLYEVR
jgi:hypothetical protein